MINKSIYKKIPLQIYIRIFVLVCVCMCVVSDYLMGQHFAWELSNGRTFRVVELSTRYFAVSDEQTVVLWDVDSETSMSFNIPKESYDFVFPIFEAHKIGVLSSFYSSGNSHDYRTFKYSIHSIDNNDIKSFEPEVDYFGHAIIRYKNEDCIMLIKKDGISDIKTLNSWSHINKDCNYTYPRSDYFGARIYVTEKLGVISPFTGNLKEVRVWDCIEKKPVITFPGVSPIRGIGLDNSCQIGAFFTEADSLLSAKNLKKQYVIQIRELTTSKILSQLIYDPSPSRMPAGIKFSPTDSRIVLVWNGMTHAILWKYMLNGEQGQIIAKIKLPQNKVHQPRDHKHYRNQKSNNDDNRPGDCIFSSDGKKIAFIYDNCKILIYSAETGKYMRSTSIKPTQ